MKKFSIITVCLNAPELERTCESVVSQAFQDFEWIVIDGGSQQKTLDIFKKYKYRMDYFVSKKDNGVYEAMNQGIQQASGERLNFLNAGDCYVDQDVLATVNSFTEIFPDADVLHGKMRKAPATICFFSDDMISNYIWLPANIPHQAMFYKCYLFKKFGNYRTDYKVVSDHEFNFKLFFNNCKFKHIDCLIVDFDTHGISSTDDQLLLHEQQKMFEEFFTSLPTTETMARHYHALCAR